MPRLTDQTFHASYIGAHFLTQHLSANGDGTGATNANGVYTSGYANGIFSIAPPANTLYYIADFHIHIEDAAIQGDQYGGVTALTNGVLLETTRGGAVTNTMVHESIQANSEWLHWGHDATMYEFPSGNEFMVVASGYFSSYGAYLLLDGDKDDTLRIVCQDDLSGLIEHSFMVQGVIATRATVTNR